MHLKLDSEAGTNTHKQTDPTRDRDYQMQPDFSVFAVARDGALKTMNVTGQIGEKNETN